MIFASRISRFGSAYGFLAIALAVVVTVCSVAAAQSMPYRLDAGDVLRISVYGQDDLSGKFDVDGDGLISLPLIGEVTAAGLTPRELEQEIVSRLKPDFLRNPQVNVEIAAYRPVYVVGEVREPGRYPYVNEMRVVNAIALAGGYTFRARQDQFAISRTVNGVEQTLNADQNTPLMPGDVLNILQRQY
jgi:protein involved in polysaccharide export with SLBB domain